MTKKWVWEYKLTWKKSRDQTELSILLVVLCKMSIFKKKGGQVNAANVHMTEVRIASATHTIYIFDMFE